MDNTNLEGYIYKIDVFALGLVFFNIYQSLDIKNEKLVCLVLMKQKLNGQYYIIKIIYRKLLDYISDTHNQTNNKYFNRFG